MNRHLTLYTRRHCCLCEEMKEVIRKVARGNPIELDEIDVDSSPQLTEAFGAEVPVLFIDRRKAFKYRVSAGELKKRLER